MAELRDVIAYLCLNYPYKNQLSNARVTKMVYLADWLSAFRRGRQLTEIEWFFNHYGPYVLDVVETARADEDFTVELTYNFFGDPKEVIRVRDGATYPSLTEEDQEILSFVIDSTASKNWEQFIQLVYSTYPVLTQERYSVLNLVELAEAYKQNLPLLQD